MNSEDIDAFPTTLLEAFTFRDSAGKGGIYPKAAMDTYLSRRTRPMMNADSQCDLVVPLS